MSSGYGEPCTTWEAGPSDSRGVRRNLSAWRFSEVSKASRCGVAASGPRVNRIAAGSAHGGDGANATLYYSVAAIFHQAGSETGPDAGRQRRAAVLVRRHRNAGVQVGAVFPTYCARPTRPAAGAGWASSVSVVQWHRVPGHAQLGLVIDGGHGHLQAVQLPRRQARHRSLEDLHGRRVVKQHPLSSHCHRGSGIVSARSKANATFHLPALAVTRTRESTGRFRATPTTTPRHSARPPRHSGSLRHSLMGVP